MATLTDMWPLALPALTALRAHYGPAMDHAAEQFGVEFGTWYGWLLAARIFEPEPVSAARLGIRGAYTSPALFERRLADGAGMGLLEPAGGDEYRLTKAGRNVTQRLVDAAYASMADLQPLAAVELERLATLLRRLVEACLAAPEPPRKWVLRLDHRLHPGESAPVVIRIDQHLSDLAAYRDDAYLAAWRPLGTSGRDWEALNFIWWGEADSAEGLQAKLARRGYTAADYAASLLDLARRGWVAEADGRWQITPAGATMCEAIEALTDRYFYAPWSVLSEAELAELRDLLPRLREGLDRGRA